MTMLVYERQEDFLEKLMTLPKTTAVYMTVVHANQNNAHVAVLRIQVPDSTGVFHTFNYSENINPVPIMDMDVVDALPNDDMKKQVLAQYKADIDKLNMDIQTEYAKLKKGLENQGYTKIVNAYSM